MNDLLLLLQLFPFGQELERNMEAVGVDVLTMNTEYGEGQVRRFCRRPPNFCRRQEVLFLQTCGRHMFAQRGMDASQEGKTKGVVASSYRWVNPGVEKLGEFSEVLGTVSEVCAALSQERGSII